MATAFSQKQTEPTMRPAGKSARGGSVKSTRAVLEALQQLNHATAQDVFEWIQRSPRNPEISLTSVYRALNQLVSQSDVKPLNFNDGQVRYELNTQHAHHHHFVCTQCNHIQVLDVCPFEDYVKALPPSFQVQYHTFDVFGVCQDCQ